MIQGNPSAFGEGSDGRRGGLRPDKEKRVYSEQNKRSRGKKKKSVTDSEGEEGEKSDKRRMRMVEKKVLNVRK